NETDLPVINDPGNIPLENVPSTNGRPDYSNGVPVDSVGNTYFAEALSNELGEDNMPILGWPAPTATTWFSQPTCPGVLPSTWSLLCGWIRIEVRDAAAPGGFRAVTKEWLELGFARGLLPPNSEEVPARANDVHPKAILTLQMHADRNGDG